MFKNYLQTAFRNLYKHKLYSFINIAGLTVGLLSCMVVATVLIDDLSYDKQWSRSNDLYRIVSVNKTGGGVYNRFTDIMFGFATELKKNYPEVEAYAELAPSELRLKVSDDENGVVIPTLEADTSFWQLLDTKILAGNPHNFVAGTTNIVISESIKNKFFKGENVIGKVVYDVPLFEDKHERFLITGVIKDIPSNTHLRADIIKLNIPTVRALAKNEVDGSTSNNYILLKPGTDINLFTKKVNNWYRSFTEAKKPLQFEFQPIKDIYLNSDFAEYQKIKGDIRNVYIFSGAALLVLLIACVNFINLSTARASTRLRETGIRKVLGASRTQIIYQFLSEALLFFTLSSVLALLFYQLSLPVVQSFIGHSLQQTLLSRFSLISGLLALVLLISIITGLYPAWLLSGFKPANTLKGRISTGVSYNQNWVRKSLVILQFSISIVVLIALVVVQQQVSFMKNADIGFDKNNLLSIGFVSWQGKGNSFKNELQKIPGVVTASQCTWIPGAFGGSMQQTIDDPNQSNRKIDLWYMSGDADFARTIGFKLVKGRLLNNEFGADVHTADTAKQNGKQLQKAPDIVACLITATTAKMLNIKRLNEPQTNKQLGKLSFLTGESQQPMPIGIVADFHNQSFHEFLGPTFITLDQSLEYSYTLIRVVPGTNKQVMLSLQNLWKQFFPGKLLNTNWVNNLLAKQYEAESKLQQLFAFFSTLTMVLAALGIFGLIVHAAQQRTKEIGVRKVLGASVASIARLLSLSFVKLVFFAFIMASPIAWFFLNKWLQHFPYRITMSWWMFALAGFAAVFIAVLTVSFQAIKAAIANPIKSLQSE